MYNFSQEITYKITYGYKESRWLGFELSGSSYAFEKHYGTLVGWFKDRVEESNFDRICSFVIGNVDIEEELIWYKGGLLKNKKVYSHGFGLPTHMTVDGTWETDATKEDMSCMVGHTSWTLTQDVLRTPNRSTILAQTLDGEFGFV